MNSFSLNTLLVTACAPAFPFSNCVKTCFHKVVAVYFTNYIYIARVCVCVSGGVMNIMIYHKLFIESG